MGYGSYSVEAHEALLQTRVGVKAQDVFTRNDCDPKMNPNGVGKRESRDSPEHPNSLGIVFALDVSGSMGEIPEKLATKTLPSFIGSVLTVNPDPQILFLAFGNAYADKSPLQVGQFESEAKLIDRWLSASHLEGGGGGLGESYDLAMYFAARHTAMDCLEKRGKKGYFFMTGDEVPFAYLYHPQVKGLIGDDVGENINITALTTELLQSFHVFFLIPDAKRAEIENCGLVWKKLLHERCVVLATPDDTAVVSAMLLGIQEGTFKDLDAVGTQLEERLGRTGEEKARVLAAVTPFFEANAKGAIAPPETVSERHDDPGLRG